MTKSIISLLIITFTSLSLAGVFSTEMEPTLDEKLDSPIVLTDNCSGVQVVEWRYTPGYSESTGPTKKSKRILNKVCNLVVSKFPEFIKKKGFKLKDANLDVNVSLMPDNSQPRNLNDLEYRFSKRWDKHPVWGYYHRPTEFMFVRNDVLQKNERTNFKFKTVFAHELYHALSYQYGVYHQYSDSLRAADIMDEKLAREFTQYIGLGR